MGLRREVKVDVADASVGGTIAIGLKRRVSIKELKEQHAKAPHVCSFVVVTAFYHFWGKIVECPAEGGSARRRSMYRPPEIRDLNGVLWHV